jgi:hypothetical protein
MFTWYFSQFCMHMQHRQFWVFQGLGMVRISFTSHPLEFCFFISPSTEQNIFWYFLWCWRVTRYLYMNFFHDFYASATPSNSSFLSWGDRYFIFQTPIHNFFISPSTENYRLWYFGRCWGVTWYVYISLFMIFIYPKYYQTRVFSGSWGGRYFICWPPARIFFYFSFDIVL